MTSLFSRRRHYDAIGEIREDPIGAERTHPIHVFGFVRGVNKNAIAAAVGIFHETRSREAERRMHRPRADASRAHAVEPRRPREEQPDADVRIADRAQLAVVNGRTRKCWYLQPCCSTNSRISASTGAAVRRPLSSMLIKARRSTVSNTSRKVGMRRPNRHRARADRRAFCARQPRDRWSCVPVGRHGKR